MLPRMTRLAGGGFSALPAPASGGLLSLKRDDRHGPVGPAVIGLRGWQMRLGVSY